MRLRSVEDPSRKLWIGNIPEQAKWKDLQALVDQAARGICLAMFGMGVRVDEQDANS